MWGPSVLQLIGQKYRWLLGLAPGFCAGTVTWDRALLTSPSSGVTAGREYQNVIVGYPVGVRESKSPY